MPQHSRYGASSTVDIGLVITQSSLLPGNCCQDNSSDTRCFMHSLVLGTPERFSTRAEAWLLARKSASPRPADSLFWTRPRPRHLCRRSRRSFRSSQRTHLSPATVAGSPCQYWFIRPKRPMYARHSRLFPASHRTRLRSGMTWQVVNRHARGRWGHTFLWLGRSMTLHAEQPGGTSSTYG